MNTPTRPADIKPTEAVAAIGHNRPPAFDADKYAELFKEALEFAEAGGEWLDLKVIETEEQAQYLVDFIAGVRAKLKAAEDWRVANKKPHDDAGREVQAAAAKLTQVLEASRDKSLALITAYQRKKAAEEAEKQRKAAEEAAAKAAAAQALIDQAAARNDIAGEVEAQRLAKEAAQDAKAAAKPVNASIGSASGGGRTIASVETRYVEIDNLMQCFMFFREHAAVRETLQSLANAHVRAKNFDGVAIPGTTTKTKVSAR